MFSTNDPSALHPVAANHFHRHQFHILGRFLGFKFEVM